MKTTAIAFLSQLLPYETESKKHGSQRTCLEEYQALNRAFLEANQALEKGELEKFDSLVGENACQIRAIVIAITFSKSLVDIRSLKDRILKVLSKVEALLATKTINSLMQSEDSFKSVLEKEELDIPLTHEEIYILQSFILSELKTVASSEKEMISLHRIEIADYKKLRQFGEVSNSFAKRLLNKLRKQLAAASIQFIRETASAFQDPSLMKMVSQDFIIKHNTLLCIPMFWTYKIVLLAAQKEQVPLIIHVKFLKEGPQGYIVINEDQLFFKFAPNGSYVATKPNESDLDKAGWVIQGVVIADKAGPLLTKERWRSSMARRPITDIILACAADHRQYPDLTKDALFETLKDCEYENYKTLAKKEGYSIENPTTFFIQHVYAVRVGNMFDNLSIQKL